MILVWDSHLGSEIDRFLHMENLEYVFLVY